MKGQIMLFRRHSMLKGIAAFAIAAVLSILATSCSNRPSKWTHAQVLGDNIAVALDGYAQDAGSGWQAVILATNTSSMKIACVAFSYAAGLPLGSSVIATNLDVETLPKILMWTRREPEIDLKQVDPRLMERFGIGRVFELQPGEHIRLLLPICVAPGHPGAFVEHFVFAFSPPSSGDAQRAYETYVAVWGKSQPPRGGAR